MTIDELQGYDSETIGLVKKVAVLQARFDSVVYR